jgi:hypothetical protein
LITAEHRGMHLATLHYYSTRVDAMILRPNLVTMGVREQAVKPATEIAGFLS